MYIGSKRVRLDHSAVRTTKNANQSARKQNRNAKKRMKRQSWDEFGRITPYKVAAIRREVERHMAEAHVNASTLISLSSFPYHSSTLHSYLSYF